MMIRTFDVVALDADTEDAARLIGLLLDLRHAKNTLLLMFPIGKSDVRKTVPRSALPLSVPCFAVRRPMNTLRRPHRLAVSFIKI